MNSTLVLGHLVVLEVEVHLALVYRHCFEPIEVVAWVLVPGFCSCSCSLGSFSLFSIISKAYIGERYRIATAWL